VSSVIFEIAYIVLGAVSTIEIGNPGEQELGEKAHVHSQLGSILE
jgi:hypothetical protein